MNPTNPNKVILGLSGGVDSTAAALLLKEKGLSVTGLFLDVTGCNEDGRHSAEKTAKELNIPFLYYDLSDRFQQEVVSNFQKEYLEGRTPNPCVVCNPQIKFRTLIEVANQQEAPFIATGHYARTYYDENLEQWFIRKAQSEDRDQSYMLYRLPKEVISRLIMPLGEIHGKDRVRQLAENAGLSNANKKDSQEICFLPEGVNYIQYLENLGVSAPKGPFLDQAGNPLGEHKGIYHYTIGQRKGLGDSFGKPMFVKSLQNEGHTVVLTDNENDLYKSRVRSYNNIVSIPFEGLRVDAKIRYAAKPAPAFIHAIEDNKIEALFDEPQRAPTPGQSIVFYLGDFVVGGGFIDPTT